MTETLNIDTACVHILQYFFLFQLTFIFHLLRYFYNIRDHTVAFCFIILQRDLDTFQKSFFLFFIFIFFLIIFRYKSCVATTLK